MKQFSATRLATSKRLLTGYTGDGLRAWKQTGAGRTYFLYDGALPVIELSATGTVTATNTFGANGLLARRVSTSSTFYTFDAQGGVAQRLDASQSVLSSHQFTAHGSETTTASSEPFGYGAQWGYYSDRETGLQLLTHRYFAPQAGRGLTRRQSSPLTDLSGSAGRSALCRTCRCRLSGS